MATDKCLRAWFAPTMDLHHPPMVQFGRASGWSNATRRCHHCEGASRGKVLLCPDCRGAGAQTVHDGLRRAWGHSGRGRRNAWLHLLTRPGAVACRLRPEPVHRSACACCLAAVGRGC